jgi:hypothetical protein
MQVDQHVLDLSWNVEQVIVYQFLFASLVFLLRDLGL